MYYPIAFRRKVLAHIEEGMGKRDAARLFKISPQTIYNWLNADDLKPSLSKYRRRKIDKEALRAHVKAYPNMLLLGSGPINYIYSARVKFLMDGRKNCVGHSRSYGQAIFTIRHKHLPRLAGSKTTQHVHRQTRPYNG